MVRSVLIVLFFSFSYQFFAQDIVGQVFNDKKEEIYGVLVSCGEHKAYSDYHGKFHFKDCKGDSIYFRHSSYENLVISAETVKKLNKIELKSKILTLDETKVIQQKLNTFDIGFLPPVKGVQIATGTSSIIQTEGQQGAKSSNNPRELFAKVPGLNIWESDGAGIQMGVGGRGLSPNRAANFNMRQNGYDISADALGYPESYYTPPLEALSSIEIIRGSASLQYGSQFGGLMNFVIKEPAKNTPFEFTSRNSVGSFGYLASFNRVTGSLKRFEYQVYNQIKKGNGYRENSNFNQNQIFAQLGYALNEKNMLRLEYTNMSYLAQQAGGLTDKLFAENPKQSIRDRNWFKVKWNMLALHYTYDISSKSIFNVRLFGMNSSRTSLGFLGKINQTDLGGDRQIIDGNFLNAGLEARFLTRYSLFKSETKKTSVKAAFLVGVRLYRGSSTSNEGMGSAGSDSNFKFNRPDDLERSSYNFPSKNSSFFIDNIWFVGKKTTVNAGFRLDYIQSSSFGFYKKYAIHPLNNDTLGIYKISDSTSLKRIVPLFGAGITRKTGKMTNLYSNFCMNYRAVNFNDIRVSNPNVVIDTLISDEYGSTTEIGFRGLLKNYFYVDIALFHLFYGNKIGLAPQENNVTKIRTNIGDARNLGIEAFAEFDFLKSLNDSTKNSLSLFVNFSYINAKYIKSKEANFVGKQVEYVSPIILKTGLKYKYRSFSTQVQYSYNSSQFSDASNAIEASGDAVIGLVPSYFVFDLSLRYDFKKWFQLEAGCNNLMNKSYYTRRATAYPGPGILPADGRSFYFTLQYKFRR